MRELEKRLKRLEQDVRSKDLRFWIIHRDKLVSVYQSHQKILFETFDDERCAAEFVENFIRSKEPAQIGGGYSECSNIFHLYVAQDEGEEIVFPLETTLRVEDIQRIHAGTSLVHNNLLESIVGTYREYERKLEEAKAILPSEEYAKLLEELGTEEK